MAEENKDPALEAAKEQTRRYARTLWETIKQYRAPASLGPIAERDQPAPVPHRNSPLLFILSLIPYLLGALFLFSFFWDFDGLSLVVWGHRFNPQGLLRILSVSGLIGFCTNWIAITMLFKPVKRRPLLGHGLIPAQKDRIAYRLAQAVSQDLINPDIIKQKIRESDIISTYRKRSTAYVRAIIDNPAFRADLKMLLTSYIEEMIANPNIREALAQKILIQIEQSVQQSSLERMALKAYSFLKGQKIQQIVEEALERIPESVEAGLDRVDLFLDDLPDQIDENSEQIESWVTSLLHKLINQLDVHSLVEDNLRNYDEQKISDIIRKATNEQLRYIQYLGGILGIIGGFVIWEPIMLVLLLLVASLIFAFDFLLLRLSSRG